MQFVVRGTRRVIRNIADCKLQEHFSARPHCVHLAWTVRYVLELQVASCKPSLLLCTVDAQTEEEHLPVRS